MTPPRIDLDNLPAWVLNRPGYVLRHADHQMHLWPFGVIARRRVAPPCPRR